MREQAGEEEEVGGWVGGGGEQGRRSVIRREEGIRCNDLQPAHAMGIRKVTAIHLCKSTPGVDVGETGSLYISEPVDTRFRGAGFGAAAEGMPLDPTWLSVELVEHVAVLLDFPPKLRLGGGGGGGSSSSSSSSFFTLSLSSTTSGSGRGAKRFCLPPIPGS